MNALATEATPAPRLSPRRALEDMVTARGGRSFATYRDFIAAISALHVTRELKVRKALGGERDRDCFTVGTSDKEELYLVFWGDGDGAIYFPAT